MFKKLDHIAIAVRDTEEALKFYCDTLQLPLLHSEVLEGPGVRLTHLDMGNLELQLVQPLSPDHPISKFLNERGEGLHHLCWATDEPIESAMENLANFDLAPKANEPHSAPNGGAAAFIDPEKTRGVLWEVTEKKSRQ
ncbi:MAG: VOC family protein [Mariniblastus sp.]